MENVPFKTSPWIIIAAVSMIIFSLVGIVAISGIIPSVSFKTNGVDAARAEPQSGKPFVSSVVPIGTERTPVQQEEGAAKACPDCGVIESITSNEGKSGANARQDIEKKVNKKVTYQVKVRMDNGIYRVISQPDRPIFHVGEKVKIDNGTVVQYEKATMSDKNLIFGLMLATLTSRVF